MPLYEKLYLVAFAAYGWQRRLSGRSHPIASSHSCGVQGHAINVKFNDTLVPQTRPGRRAFESQIP
jgi:hypothetical protein